MKRETRHVGLLQDYSLELLTVEELLREGAVIINK